MSKICVKLAPTVLTGGQKKLSKFRSCTPPATPHGLRRYQLSGPSRHPGGSPARLQSRLVRLFFVSLTEERERERERERTERKTLGRSPWKTSESTLQRFWETFPSGVRFRVFSRSNRHVSASVLTPRGEYFEEF